MNEAYFEIEFLKEKKVKVKENQSILNASLEAGIPHYHACGGNGKCSTCRILVLEGINHLSERNDKEIALAKEYHLPDEVRLACQTNVNGQPVKIQRIIRDDSDKELYLPIHEKNLPYEKEMVLMFLDIRNFTPFSASLPPFDIVHILKKMFIIFETTINAYEGSIIETAGDGLYAVFGMNSQLRNAAANAIAACEKILKRVKTFNELYLKLHFSHTLEIGIGLHSGMVIVGNISINKTSHLIVTGYPVNIASRIQTATRELNNNFLISEYVASLLFDCSTKKIAKVIHAKGVIEDIKVFSLGTKYSEN